MSAKIFLSHNYHDKPVVEQVAIKLRDIFGEKNVFYDSWSIQPGESIIDQMNKGMEAPEYVFFFVSKQSLKSGFVKLEWQTALAKASKGLTKLVPIRLDSEPLPQLLQTTLYLDLFQNGLENTLAQIVSICQGHGTFQPQFQNFSNLTFKAKVSQNKDEVEIEIIANHYVENNLNFVILSNNKHEEMELKESASTSMAKLGFGENEALADGRSFNMFMINPLGAVLKPGFPLRLKFKKKEPNTILTFYGVMHETSENTWKELPGKFV